MPVFISSHTVTVAFESKMMIKCRLQIISVKNRHMYRHHHQIYVISHWLIMAISVLCGSTSYDISPPTLPLTFITPN